MQIPFNKIPCYGNEKKYVLKALSSDKISGNGKYTKKVESWFKENLQCEKALLTTSCTHALEMSAILLNVEKGDEIIMPSYTFVSSANAFVLRGATIVFVDINPHTMNIDEHKILEAITKKTKAIVVIHYGGVACEMDTIMSIAKKNKLFVIEDAAQAMMAMYKGKALGTIGHLGTYSFHETKNFTSGGEGGLLIINDDQFTHRAQIVRDKGTNRALFLEGKVDKYSWVDLGSSYLVNDVSAAYLWGQLKKVKAMNRERINSWNRYYRSLIELENKGFILLPKISTSTIHNAHTFQIKAKDLDKKKKLLKYLSNQGITALSHYVPLHSSPAGKKFARFHERDIYTTKESNRLIRLPIFYGITKTQIDFTVEQIFTFYKQDNRLK